MAGGGGVCHIWIDRNINKAAIWRQTDTQTVRTEEFALSDITIFLKEVKAVYYYRNKQDKPVEKNKEPKKRPSYIG